LIESIWSWPSRSTDDWRCRIVTGPAGSGRPKPWAARAIRRA
jgi:hypothetical protein